MATKSKHPKEIDLLSKSCYLKGQSSHQDAYFILLADNTVHVLIHTGDIRSREDVFSVKQASKLRDNLLQKGWQLVSRPRRTEEQVHLDIKASVRKFLAKRTHIRREPDPDANIVPPEREMQRQRERFSLTSAASTNGVRVLPGGGFETNKRRH